MTIPYSLVSNDSNPLRFYDDLSIFTDTVQKKGSMIFSDIIEEFKSFALTQSWQTYSADECLIEILMLGIFSKNYSRYVSSKVKMYQSIFAKLYAVRKNHPRLKPQVDQLRGRLGTKLLLAENKKETDQDNYHLLIQWLRCTNEFSQETERLSYWIDWLRTKDSEFEQLFAENVGRYANWFSEKATKKLGNYTAGWKKFMAENASVYSKREDHIFCTRQPNEYYLNMVAAEVMNRKLRPDFIRTPEKILLLPTCMARKSNCAARLENNRLVCSNCSVDCNVARLKQKMELQHVKTVLIPHSSGFSKFLEPWKNSETTALIGVACVLNLLAGGYEMQKLNIPSQCIFLDSCGCKKHWLSGKPTNINEKQLDRLLAC